MHPLVEATLKEWQEQVEEPASRIPCRLHRAPIYGLSRTKVYEVLRAAGIDRAMRDSEP